MRCMLTSPCFGRRTGEFEEGDGVVPKNYKMGRNEGLASKIGEGFYVGGAKTRCG
jgi:hypothetical protein